MPTAFIGGMKQKERYLTFALIAIIIILLLKILTLKSMTSVDELRLANLSYLPDTYGILSSTTSTTSKPNTTRTTSTTRTTTTTTTTTTSTTIKPATKPPELAHPRTVLISPDSDYCEGLRFLVVVHSRLTSHKRRDQWRRTYGRGELERKYRYKLVFPVGIATDPSNHAKRQRAIENEAKFHGDILQADYKDTYKTMTFKQLSHLRYFEQNCSSQTMLLKLDDDAAWNVNKVSSFMDKEALNLRQKLACFLWTTMGVERNNASKWYVAKEEFAENKFPPYCSGLAYIAGHEAVEWMLRAVDKSPYIWVDDVYITGFLTGTAKLDFIEINDQYEYQGRDELLRNGTVMFFLSNRVNTLNRFSDIIKNETFVDDVDYKNSETFSDY